MVAAVEGEYVGVRFLERQRADILKLAVGRTQVGALAFETVDEGAVGGDVPAVVNVRVPCMPSGSEANVAPRSGVQACILQELMAAAAVINPWWALRCALPWARTRPRTGPFSRDALRQCCPCSS